MYLPHPPEGRAAAAGALQRLAGLRRVHLSKLARDFRSCEGAGNEQAIGIGTEGSMGSDSGRRRGKEIAFLRPSHSRPRMSQTVFPHRRNDDAARTNASTGFSTHGTRTHTRRGEPRSPGFLLCYFERTARTRTADTTRRPRNGTGDSLRAVSYREALGECIGGNLSLRSLSRRR